MKKKTPKPAQLPVNDGKEKSRGEEEHEEERSRNGDRRGFFSRRQRRRLPRKSSKFKVEKFLLELLPCNS